MRLSTAAGRYGIRAMYDLAARYGKGPVSGKDIARRQRIALPYLEQLMNRLRRSGLVRSVRGPQGGFLLARSPGRIKVGAIMRVLEGPIQMSHCGVGAGAKSSCGRAETCVSRILMKKLDSQVKAALDTVSLRDLCREAGMVSPPLQKRRKSSGSPKRGGGSAGGSQEAASRGPKGEHGPRGGHE
ncbi:MAG: Rrf2 family transcriptional regulator [Candidatus Eisenbacteria bacterium]